MEKIDYNNLINLMKIHDLMENHRMILQNILKLSSSEFELNHEELLDLFNKCFKYVVGVKRNQYRKLMTIIQRDILREDTKNLSIYDLIKNDLAKDISLNSTTIIEICDNFLKTDKLKMRSKIFFLKNKADHYRYLQEITDNNDFTNEAKKYYTEAITLTKGLNLTDTTYLTLYLNYSVFLHDVLNDRLSAIKNAKMILHAALKDTDEITENHQKDIIILCQMIKDNLSLWKTEIPEELNNI